LPIREQEVDYGNYAAQAGMQDPSQGGGTPCLWKSEDGRKPPT